jgi:hypothetical protein
VIVAAFPEAFLTGVFLGVVLKVAVLPEVAVLVEPQAAGAQLLVRIE